MVAADGDSAARLASVLAGDYVHVVAIAELDDTVAEAVQLLDPDVLVLAGGASMTTARAVAEAVAATASRVTVMIVDDAGAMADTRVFWPKDRTYRTATAVEPLPFPVVDLLACA
jgi:hypothetical protein